MNIDKNESASIILIMAQNRLTRIDFDAVNFLRYRFHHGVFRQVDGGDKYSGPLVKGVILLKYVLP